MIELFKMLSKPEHDARTKIAYKRKSKWKLSKDKESLIAIRVRWHRAVYEEVQYVSLNLKVNDWINDRPNDMTTSLLQ